MRKYLSISFIAIIFLLPVGRVGILVRYSISHNYIIKFLCINRDAPELKCDGKCWLKKELGRTEGTPDQLPPEKNEIPDFSLFHDPEMYSLKDLFSTESDYYLCCPAKKIIPGIIEDIFHPPRT